MPDNRIDDLEERLLILRDKAAREGFRVPDEVLDYIAEKYALPQTLKGGLINVAAYAQRRGIPITMDIARLQLDGIRPGSETSAAPVDDLGVSEEPLQESLVDEADLDDPGVDEEPYEEPLGETLYEEPRPEGHSFGSPVTEAPVSQETQVDAPPLEQPACVEPLVERQLQEEPPAEAVTSLEDALASVLDTTPDTVSGYEPDVQSGYDPHAQNGYEPHAQNGYEPDLQSGYESQPAPVIEPEGTLFVSEAPSQPPLSTPTGHAGYGPPDPVPATVWFAPVRTTKKESLVKRAGRLLQRAGLAGTIADGDLVAIKLHFGEEGSTGFVNPVFVREVVRLVREQGGKPFLTDSNTLYRGQRSNAVEHLECALHNGFSYATVEAPLVIADGLDGREAIDVPIEGYDHFETVRIGSAAVHADAMVVVTHVKGHEAVGMGGAIKNVGMGLGSRSAKQRMHSDLKPQVNPEKCSACGRCSKWCPVAAITIGPDRVATIDYELCYGCGECVAACADGAIGIQWKTDPAAIQEKIVEHTAGVLAGKDGKIIYLSFINNVSPDCDCWHFSDASIVGDIGVLASTDIVAIDQAAHDLVTQAKGLAGTRGEGLGEGTDKFHEVTGIDPTLAFGYAERHGLGRRSYELKTLD